MGFLGDIRRKAKEQREVEKARSEARRNQFKKEAVEKIGTGLGKVMGDPLRSIGKAGVAGGRGFAKASKFGYKGMRKFQKIHPLSTKTKPKRRTGKRRSPKSQGQVIINLAPAAPKVKSYSKKRKRRKDPFALNVIGF